MAADTASPFTRGCIYSRRRDIHTRFKGSQYGGISPTKSFPFIFLFTGDAGESYGYSDTWKDGLFLYSGEGQLGDQRMAKGNKAILEHATNGKELLLFKKVAKGSVRFEGFFHCVGWENQPGKDRDGNLRSLIVFHLKPEEILDSRDAQEPTSTLANLETLRNRAYAASQRPNKKMTATESSRSYYERSNAIREYVLKRANGICECCGSEAPFIGTSGTPYLESHHIHRLSDRGLDDPRHVAGICPNCHREIHHGQNGSLLDDRLLEAVSAKEINPDRPT